MIDEDLIDAWGLVYVSMDWVATINGTKPAKSYEMRLALGGTGDPGSLTVDPLVVMARRSPFKGVPYRGLLGRDVLNQCVLVYDGPAHQCSLTF